MDVTFGAEDFKQRLNVSRETLDCVERFRTILADASARTNLVGPSALTAFWLRHAFDSAQLLSFAPQAKIWLDIGSGAGFPGVILAILLKGTPGTHVHMVDSVGKKTSFLLRVITALELPATVHMGRSEALVLPKADVVTARACAPLPRLFGFIAPHMNVGTTALLLKGQNLDCELTQARESWMFESEQHLSQSDPAGRILMLLSLKAQHNKQER